MPKTNIILPIGLLLSLVSVITVIFSEPSLIRLGAAVLLMCVLPGWAVVRAVFSRPAHQLSLLEEMATAMATSYLITIVGGLWLYYALGSLGFGPLLALYTLISVAGFGWAIFQEWGQASKDWRWPDRYGWLLLALIIFAAFFRFYNLSYSDYRGDEAEIILRGISAIRGEGMPILSHTKGPAETLLAGATGLIYGAFDERAIRFPFALANLLAVIAVYLLGERLFGRKVALIAVALIAINGWYITYSRTAQYQNIVLPMLTLGVWGYVRFYQTTIQRYVLFGTLFMAVATFGHYEGASAAPAALFLLILGLKKLFQKHQTNSWTDKFRLAWPTLLALIAGGVVALSFYGPFILSPTVAGAQGHVSKRFGDTPPYNNWDAFYVNGLFYNSIYYVLTLGAILLIGTLRGVHQALGAGKRGFIGALVALPLLLLSWTGILPPWYGLIIYLALMGLFLLSKRVSVNVKVLLLWILLPMALYLFAVIRPGNHYYVFVPALVLLAALTIERGLSYLFQWQSPARYWALGGVAAVLLLLFGLASWYQQLLFLQTDKEYMLTWPEHQNPIFVSDERFPFDIRIGWGFPYRLGWQTVGEMYRSGELEGDWYSTDAGNSIYWYTGGAKQNPCYPHYYMLTEIGYKDPLLEVPQEIIDQHYVQRTAVSVNGLPRLSLYEFSPGEAQGDIKQYDEPARYPTLPRQEIYHGEQDGPIYQPSDVILNPPQRFKPHPTMLEALADVYNDPNTILFDEDVSLLGYDLDTSRARPGGVILLTLYWQADSAVFLPYKVFTHLKSDQLWAQADSEPACGHFPTYNWRIGDQIMDRHAIFLPADIPPGDYALEVGLYEVRSGLRMDKLDEAGNPAGNWLNLPPINVSREE